MKNRKEEDKNLGEAIQESKQMFKVIFLTNLILKFCKYFSCFRLNIYWASAQLW